MNNKRLLELFWELDEEIKSQHALYLDSLVSYSLLNERLLAHQARTRAILGDNHEYSTVEYQNGCSILYKELSSCDYDVMSVSPVMKQGELSARVAKGGQNTLRLGDQCVITAYTRWDEYYREEIAGALSIPTKNLEIDFWGDLRLMRNSILHNKSVGNDKMADCKQITWFKPGDRIVLDYAKMTEIFIGMTLTKNDVHSLSLSPSPKIAI